MAGSSFTGPLKIKKSDGTRVTFVNADGEVVADIKDTLAEGSIYVGNSSNITSELDASGDGKVLVGDGTTLASVSTSGDATIDKTGLITVTQAAGPFSVGGDLTFPEDVAHEIKVDGQTTADTAGDKLTVEAGAGGATDTGTAGAGGDLELNGADGGSGTGVAATGGAGSNVAITAGDGGNDTEGSAGTGGDGGRVVIAAGSGGTGNTAGSDGYIALNSVVAMGQAVQALSGPGAIDTVSQTTAWTTTGIDAGTLADSGIPGQMKTIFMAGDGGDGTLTPTSLLGYSTITFNDVGDAVQLVWSGTDWIITSNQGCALA